ncbi:glycine receptor subunit alpha-4-like [Macrobrachium rosenbergii]|uniref:glycine receptor subunit alpha-4-like n=1 Tax=Macrobrachium rosenbergii TaxID=79674 RepID=UPI0034D39C29
MALVIARQMLCEETGLKMALIFLITLAMASASPQMPSFNEGYHGLNDELWKLDQLFRIGDREMYDRRQTPGAAAGIPTQVFIEMYLRSFGSINPIHMDYTVDLYLRQRWLEFRFLNNTLTRPLDLSDPILVKMLWKPEVYFPNAKESDFQYVTVPNVMLRIHPDGTILYILRLKLTFSCMMDLSSFPLDHQTCYIQVASFVKTTRELELVWYKDDPIKIYKRLKLPQFEMKDILAGSCSLSFHIGNYSCLQAAFELRRNVGYHLVQSYLPTSLIVVVSWVSFWLDVDAIPSRVTLGVTTLLTVCSESTSFRDKMPTVSYVKALDIWMGSCTAFVFLALVEFTVVNHLARHHRRFFFWGAAYARHSLNAALTGEDHLDGSLSLHSLGKSSSVRQSTVTTITTSQTLAYNSPSNNSNRSQGPSPEFQEGSPEEDGGTIYKIVPNDNYHRYQNDDCHPYTARSGGETSFSQVTRRRPSLGAVPRPDIQSSASSSSHQEGLVLQPSHYLQGKNMPEILQPAQCTEGKGVSKVHKLHFKSPPSDLELSSLPLRWKQEALLAKKIDKICRAVFPITFGVFNVVYWVYFKVLE